MLEEKKGIDRVIVLQKVNEQATKEIIEKILRCEDDSPTQPIRVIVNTYGGHVVEMFALYDTFKLCRAPIITIGVGKIMSAGVLLLSAGEKGERRIGRNAIVMIHEVWSVLWGSLYNLESEVKEVRRLQDQMLACLCKETGQKASTLKKIFGEHKDEYLLPNQAKKLGIVDKVV